ncbi:MAG: DNRLRE domain-containing protein [Chitinophagales bacterium]|nr:T9SS type A sorting domain-containing protein [Bacteroidota bacterium]MBX7139514.1 DNRLRE domain-containing protein [Chitinophagales bacterium]
MKLFTFSLIAIGSMISSQRSHGQTFVLTPSKDASIGFHDNYNSANTNYGNAIHYSGFSQPGASGGENAGMGIMAFDLSMLPPGTVIADARLDLFGCGPFGAGDAASVGDLGHNACYLERITTDWDEYTVTYNTQPLATTMHRAHLQWSTSVDEDYTDINVTAMVQDMINDPEHSFGIRIRLRNEEPTRAMAFWSKDGAPSDDLKPHLRITLQNEGLTSAQEIKSQVSESLIYPNPFHLKTTIEFNNDFSASKAHMLVVNMLGQVVSTQDVSGMKTAEFDARGLNPGVYRFMVIVDGLVAERGELLVN